MLNLLFQHTYEVRPSLSMKILSINNFTTLLLSKLFSDLSIGVHLKGTARPRDTRILVPEKNRAAQNRAS